MKLISINHAILGLLSHKPMTGYDLKKLIQESSFLYWSGNNNQIYKALVELLNAGFVTNEVRHQDSSPSKKIYTITSAGLAELRKWVVAPPEPPEFKKTFLIQLAWADQLNPDELNALLAGYEQEVRTQLLLLKGQAGSEHYVNEGNVKGITLWKLIHSNLISTYNNELTWLAELRQELGLT
ncbi:PadR family transcriptional regulator [Paenibacillus sonchi]|uniref:PadR family transcriptional regulator n=1 Tax=Paenibacillus sonchi TaxID=373687 RepID=UPI001F3BF46E|nr:PadR family transcriptional regulator [Paenibacillus sonchi]